MKSVAPTGKHGFIQGYFRPTNQRKLLKPTEAIIYRSSYELQFCRICDTNPVIKFWQSEPIQIQYYDPVKCVNRAYYPDYIIVTESQGKVNKTIIEVKPLTFITKPEYPKKVTAQTLKGYNFRLRIFVTNMAKMKAAKTYAEARGMTYSFLTDAFFNKFKI